MARPKLKEARKQYTVMLKPSVVDELDKFANKLNMSRSQLMANLIDSALEDAKILDKMGVLRAFMFGDKMIQKIKRSILGGKYKVSKDGELKIDE